MKNSNTFGFVYVLSNESMPGLVKVGLTTALPEDRSKQLFTTAIPTPFEVEFRIMTSNPNMLESKAHAILDDVRVNNRREFFRTSIEDAIGAVRLAAYEVNGIENWATSELHKIPEGEKLILSLEKGQVFSLLSYLNWNSPRAELIDLWQAHSHGDQLELHGLDNAASAASFSSNDPYAEFDPVPFLDREGKVVNGMINGREILFSGERLVWLPSFESKDHQTPVVFEANTTVQVISRTWTPCLSPIGFPLILNDFLYDGVWEEAKRGVERALSLSLPRTWAPRSSRCGEWESVGINHQPPTYWLPQLQPKR
ncbi:GIY-YIG nuclease family protein [Vibrio scophthalmi]|uniref:GIY-YIG nuclease family protein n=1 Tax=Vibrio scophthalmi TaxID=45658 RepID=UPI003AAA6676